MNKLVLNLNTVIMAVHIKPVPIAVLDILLELSSAMCRVCGLEVPEDES
jgi:hypothetical protein